MSIRPILCTLTAAIIIIMAGCNSDGCLNNQNALPQAAFFSGLTDKQMSVRGVEVRGVGAPGDSVLISPTSAVSTFYLPMRSDRGSTEWEFNFVVSEKVSITDYITFEYTSQPHFASEECGAMYFYHIDRVDYTTNVIDSVVVLDSLITNYDMTRIRIYIQETPVGGEEEEAPEEPES